MRTLTIILPGMSGGTKADFIQKLTAALPEDGEILALDYPSHLRGEKKSLDADWGEEVSMLAGSVGDPEDYDQIAIYAKSLGGLIATEWLQRVPVGCQGRIRLVIFGCLIGRLDGLARFSGSIRVIQGERDCFGDAEVVREYFSDLGISGEIVSVPGDHSYREGHEEEAIRSGLITR